MRKITLTLFLFIAVTVGLPLVQVLADEEKPLVEYVHSLQQAKDILRPDRRWLMVTRDPFDPIIVVAPPVYSSSAVTNNSTVMGHAVVAGSDDQLDDVRLIGVVKLENEYRAYITVGEKGRVIELLDKIRNYTITNINMDQIVLTSNGKEVIKKRGKL